MRLRAAAFAFAAVLSGGAPTPAQSQAQCAGFVDVAGSDTACAGMQGAGDPLQFFHVALKYLNARFV